MSTPEAGAFTNASFGSSPILTDLVKGAGKNPKTGFDRHAKVLANEWEANLALQQKYPDVIPKSYEKADDFSWILVEKVTPINNRTMFNKLNLLSDKYDYLLVNINNKNKEVRDKAYGDLQSLLSVPINHMKGIQDPTKKRWSHSVVKEVAEPTTATIDWGRGHSDDSTVDIEKAAKPAGFQKDELEILNNIFSNPHNKKLFLAIAELGIPVQEILGKNLGLNSEGNLILLDVSLWGKVKKGTEL